MTTDPVLAQRLNVGGVGSREGIAAANFGMRSRRSQSFVEQAGGGGGGGA